MQETDSLNDIHIFGYWKEYGDDFSLYPSVHEYVNREINATYNKAKLINYLSSAEVIAVTSRVAFPSPFDGSIAHGSLAVRTDGEWYWLDNICKFIEENDLILPENFYRHIMSRLSFNEK